VPEATAGSCRAAEDADGGLDDLQGVQGRFGEVVVKRSRYQEGPMTDAAMREWMEFEARKLGLDPKTLTEREQKILEALAVAERGEHDIDNRIKLPEAAPKKKRVKTAGRKAKMLPDDAPMYRAWRDKRR
jgi:hypothetical protein